MEYIEDYHNNNLQVISEDFQIKFIENINRSEKMTNILKKEYLILKKKWKNIELLELLNINHPLLPDFYDIDSINQNIQYLKNKSNNGFISLINYEKYGLKYKAVLKSIKIDYQNSNDDQSKLDNLYYEYLVGLCINKLSLYFPNFVKTYIAGIYIKQEFHEYFYKNSDKKKIKLINKLSHYIKPINSDNIEENIDSSCENWSKMALVIQWIPVYLSLLEYLPKISNGFIHKSKFKINKGEEKKMIQYIKLLYIIYTTLTSVKDTFTHYDLHEENILITSIPNNKYISLTYHLPDGSIRVVNTYYLPVLIDYGRSYINCDNPLFNSDCPSLSSDLLRCNFSEKRQHNVTFLETSEDDYYINSSKRNISHDLRLISDINTYYDFNDLDSSINFIQLWKKFMSKIYYINKFGTPEAVRVSKEKQSMIYNVIRAYEELDKIIFDPSFILMDDIENIGEKLGNIDIMMDMSSQFIFTQS
jgi:hypothetical protein